MSGEECHLRCPFAPEGLERGFSAHHEMKEAVLSTRPLKVATDAVDILKIVQETGWKLVRKHL